MKAKVIEKRILLSSIFFATVFLGFVSDSKSQVLSAKELKDIKGSIIHGCILTQRSSPLSQNFSDKQIRYYCTCYAEELILPTTTVQDVIKAMKELNSKGNDAMLGVLLKGRSIYSIAASCSAQALQ